MSVTGLLNTCPALVIAYMSLPLPFCAWMLKDFFDSIPAELEEAAMIDGCSRTCAFLRVVFGHVDGPWMHPLPGDRDRHGFAKEVKAEIWGTL